MVTMCLSIRFYSLCLDGDQKSPGDLLHSILSKSKYSLMSNSWNVDGWFWRFGRVTVI